MNSPDIDRLDRVTLLRVSRLVCTESQRQVLGERMGGTSWTELEVMTGLSVSTLRGHYNRARRNIREALAKGLLEGADDE